MLKVGIVGCGGIAAVHAIALAQMEMIELTAFADIKKERADSFVEQYGAEGAKSYGSIEEMLEESGIEALHICTPHYLHVPMAAAALKKGIHVFMEKPPAITREQAAELKAAVEASDAKLGICFQNRYNATTKKVDELLQSSEVGKIRGARAFVTWHRTEPYYTESGWRGALATEGGGVLINQSVHTLDLLVRWMGTPIETEASMSNHHLKGVIEVEDTLEAYIRFDTDGRETTACFYATTAHVDDAPVIIELACEHATIRLEDTNVICRYRDGRVDTYSCVKANIPGKSYWGAGHADCIADYYDCLTSGRDYPNALPHVENTLHEMLDIYESAREHKVVKF